MLKLHDIREFNGVKKDETNRASLMVIKGEEHWLPKSQTEITDNHDGTWHIQMPEWLADEKGLN